jgi:hypothetical protein
MFRKLAIAASSAVPDRRGSGIDFFATAYPSLGIA